MAQSPQIRILQSHENHPHPYSPCNPQHLKQHFIKTQLPKSPVTAKIQHAEEAPSSPDPAFVPLKRVSGGAKAPGPKLFTSFSSNRGSALLPSSVASYSEKGPFRSPAMKRPARTLTWPPSFLAPRILRDVSCHVGSGRNDGGGIG